MARSEVVILGSRTESWHGIRLRQALERHGLAVRRLGFDQCRLDAGGGPGGPVLGDLDDLPAAVVVRSIPAGSFEQVTLRLGLLHALAELGVLVVNTARAIERCVDKSMTSFLLARAGLPTPPTWVTETAEEAATIAAREQAAGRALVVKPLFGAQGKGLRLVREPGELPDPAEVGGVYYLQRFVGRPTADGAGWRDFRVFVVGSEAVAAMARQGTTWITNIGRGGQPVPVPARGILAELAVAAAAAVGADHAGVDLIETAEGGFLVLEVNSMPAWQGLQSVTPTDIADRIAAHVAARVRPVLEVA
ncbi:ATP-grasp domain-containing protein [Benzoatithermus flavus]|uniref:RimK family alpha-L-glutamate ligase n=1 Tax=Benzoatithermus flavus TaxID=3108223 RepID=A0ABU8XPQ7_9PROT